jgi:hypothetical protein
MYVRTPNVNQMWEARNLDTLSRSTIGGVRADGSTFTRSAEAAVDRILCLKFTTGITVTVDKVRNLEIKSLRNISSQLLYGQVDSLRSWKHERLIFQLQVPINLGYIEYSTSKTTDVTDFTWVEYDVQERYVPPSSNSSSQEWYITALRSIVTNVEYNFILSKNDYIYRSTIDSLYVSITNYDPVKKRISGRFSFKVIGSINKEVIELRDGVFENVRVLMR